MQVGVRINMAEIKVINTAVQKINEQGYLYCSVCKEVEE
jgi:RNA polymerase-binding transcription factor DksA